MSRWSERADVPRGDRYDARWAALEAAGEAVHGEAELVDSLVPPGAAVLDAGCGTGRVAIELARRGHRVVGVDLDETMLATARDKAPELHWVHADLEHLRAEDISGGSGAGSGVAGFDAIVLAGNVMIFLTPGSEAATVSSLSALLAPGGLLIAGFQLQPGRLQVGTYDQHAADAGLVLADRWSTWDREPFADDGAATYAVSVHTRTAR